MWNLRKIEDEDKWFPVPESGRSLYGRETNGTVLGTFGFNWGLSEKVVLDLEIRYAHWLAQGKDNVGTGDANTGSVEVRLGLGINFGGKMDRDGDGIEDKFDVAPLEAEDFDLALADPPYDQGLAGELLRLFERRGFAWELWVEHRSAEIVPRIQGLRQRRYGDTTLSILEKSS